MEKQKLINFSNLHNGGQRKEQNARFTLTGEVIRPDHIKAEDAPDVLDIQLKSAKATVCKGLDIAGHIAKDAASRYAYITNNNEMFLMSPAEYLEFASKWSYVDRESKKNGGSVKIRLKNESKAMLAWLEERLS